MTERTLYHRGAYKGVPFEIHHDHITPWGAVDPKRADKNAGVLMCYGSEGNGDWDHVAYGEEQERLVERALSAIKDSKFSELSRGLRQQVGEEAWQEALTMEGSEEDAVEALLSEMGAASPREWAAILTLAGVPHKFSDISVTDDEQYETLYFFEDAREFSAAENKSYDEFITRVKNWVQGFTYSAHTPLDECYSFCEEADPLSNKKCEVLSHIHEQIDWLRNKKTGNYIVEADYVTSESTGKLTGDKNKWQYDDTKTIKFHLDDKEDAKRLSEFYRGHAIIIERAGKAAER